MRRWTGLALAAAMSGGGVSGGAALAQTGPTVRVTQGALQGVAQEGVETYKGVPYAAPPTGPLRWRPTAEPTAWSGVRPATAFGASCPQPGSAFMNIAPSKSEDCLTLNV